MITSNITYPTDKQELYHLLAGQIKIMTENVPHFISNLANISALLRNALPDINWVGFYLIPKYLPHYFDMERIAGKEEILIVGPFQGLPACIEIPIGKGVCGTAVAENAVMLVPNVHEFPGHIACDSASNSEIVLPLHNDAGEVVGVLDIDSPSLGRFDESDQEGLLAIVEIIEHII